jgi:hypothetical protein
MGDDATHDSLTHVMILILILIALALYQVPKDTRLQSYPDTVPIQKFN